MCFTRYKKKKINKKNKKKKKKRNIVYPEESQIQTDHIQCAGCKQSFTLESNQIKINCAGCDRFYHCCIAGKCIGKNCSNHQTILGEIHQLSWCIYCVPGIPQNKVGGKNCLCYECHQEVK